MGPLLLRPLVVFFGHLGGLNTGVHFGDTKGHRKEQAFRGWGVDAVKTWHRLAGDPAMAKCHGQWVRFGVSKGHERINRG